MKTKLFYSLTEISRITDLEQYVLRYWESEFDQLKPQKNRAGNRVYTHSDIRLILEIKRLLREERFTIDGAKQVLKTWNDPHREQEKLNFGGGSNDRTQHGRESYRDSSSKEFLSSLR